MLALFFFLLSLSPLFFSPTALLAIAGRDWLSLLALLMRRTARLVYEHLLFKNKSVNNTDMTSATQRAQKHMKNGRFSSLGLPSSCSKRRYLKFQGKQAAHRAQQLQHLRAAAAFFLLGSPWERHCRHRVGGVMPSRSGDCGEKVFLVLQHPRLCFPLCCWQRRAEGLLSFLLSPNRITVT